MFVDLKERPMDVFVARQPIFDQKQSVFAYELLFRCNDAQNFFTAIDGDQATSSVLSNSFHAIGMDNLTDGKLAFVNFTRNLLLLEVPTLFPKDMVAVEILETVEPEEAVVQACKKMKDQGYLIVLDDFILKEKFRPLIELTDIVKVDFTLTQGAERKAILDKINTTGLRYLAEKVETLEEFQQAVEYGYSYFQGYFFSKPKIVSGREITGNKLNYLRLLKDIHRPGVKTSELEETIKKDVSISYKLLNYINSAFFSLPQKVRSIQHVLNLLGPIESKKWLTVIALGQIASDKPPELVVTSLIRGNFCEMLAEKVGLERYSSELFLVGLFSLIDAFFDQPLDEILAHLPIVEEIKKTLLGEETKFQNVLQMIVHHEKGDWPVVNLYMKKLGLQAPDVLDIYLKILPKCSIL